MINTTIPLPSQFVNVPELISRGFGVSHTAAQLIALETIAIAAGGSYLVRSPDMRDYPPALNLGFNVTNSLMHGALILTLAPVIDEARTAAEIRLGFGAEHIKATLEVKSFEYGDALRSIATVESELAQAESERRANQETPKAPSDPMAAASKTGGNYTWDPTPELLKSLERLRVRRDQLMPEVAALRLQNKSRVIRDDASWEDFPLAPLSSPDGYLTQIASTPLMVAQLLSLSASKRKACADLLQRSRIGSVISGAEGEIIPGASVCISAGPELWSRLLSHPGLSSSGFFDGFLWIHADAENFDCDPAAVAELQQHRAWQEFVSHVFRARLCNPPKRLLLDRAGFRQFFAFREWCEQFDANIPSRLRRYFDAASLSEQALRIALGLAILNGKADIPELASTYFDSAGEFLKALVPTEVEFLQQAVVGSSGAEELLSGADRVARKLKFKGPLTLRQIVRGFSGQDYELVGMWTREARVQGLIEQQGSLFFLKDGNVNASVEPNVVNFEDGVSPRA